MGKVFTHPAVKKVPKKNDKCVSCGGRTHAPSREPELKSGALDHSAKLTSPKLAAGMDEIRFVRHAETRDLKVQNVSSLLDEKIRTKSLYSSVAEHWSCKPGVESSILSGGMFPFAFEHPANGAIPAPKKKLDPDVI